MCSSYFPKLVVAFLLSVWMVDSSTIVIGRGYPEGYAVLSDPPVPLMIDETSPTNLTFSKPVSSVTFRGCQFNSNSKTYRYDEFVLTFQYAAATWSATGSGHSDMQNPITCTDIIVASYGAWSAMACTWDGGNNKNSISINLDQTMEVA